MGFDYLEPEMNGTDEGVMKSLLASCQRDDHGILDGRVILNFMAELWARGVTKDQFLTWVKKHEPDTDKGPMVTPRRN